MMATAQDQTGIVSGELTSSTISLSIFIRQYLTRTAINSFLIDANAVGLTFVSPGLEANLIVSVDLLSPKSTLMGEARENVRIVSGLSSPRAFPNVLTKFAT